MNEDTNIPPPLAGVRVLDFGRYIAGPYCAALLADYGAEVIRIEKETGSEDRYVTPVRANGDGALFLQMNRNKRGVAYNPTSLHGRAVTAELVATADIIIANLPNNVLERMGLSYAQLRTVKPDIILVTMSAFGPQGPWRDRVGFDSIGQAMCGAAYLSGSADGPARTQVPWVDFSTAVHCAFGALLALRQREATGQGQHVEGSLLGSALNATNTQLIEKTLTHRNRPPLGSDAAGAAPVGFCATRDGWIVIHVVGQPIFARLARLIEREDWLADPAYASDLARGDHRAPILAEVRRWSAARTTSAALEALGQARIPAGPVLAPADILNHEQIAAAGIYQYQESEPAATAIPIARAPLWLSSYDPECRPAPALGADTARLLTGASIDDAS